MIFGTDTFIDRPEIERQVLFTRFEKQKVVDGMLWCHYDIANDVFYFRLLTERNTPTLGEETPDGLILSVRQDNKRVIGLTVVNWWKRFRKGHLPDSIHELEQAIEPWAKKLAA